MSTTAESRMTTWLFHPSHFIGNPYLSHAKRSSIWKMLCIHLDDVLNKYTNKTNYPVETYLASPDDWALFKLNYSLIAGWLWQKGMEAPAFHDSLVGFTDFSLQFWLFAQLDQWKEPPKEWSGAENPYRSTTYLNMLWTLIFGEINWSLRGKFPSIVLHLSCGHIHSCA